MTRDELIRMAREAGITGPGPARHGFMMYANPERIERFAALVAAAEREACANVCETLRDEWAKLKVGATNGRYDMMEEAAAVCEDEIRARGEQERG